MSDYRLYSWGLNSVVASGSAWINRQHQSLDTFKPEADFWIEVTFDISRIGEDWPASPPYYFLVCNSKGLANYVKHNFFPEEEEMTLRNVVLIHTYSYGHIIRYLRAEVDEKCAELTNEQLFLYLATRFDMVED